MTESIKKSWDTKKIFWGVLMAVLTAFWIHYAPIPLFKGLLVLVGGLCLNEFLSSALPKHPLSSPLFGTFIGSALLAYLLYASKDFNLNLGGFALLIIGIFSFYLFRKPDFSVVLQQVSITALACLYLAVLFVYPGLIREIPNGSSWIFFLASTTFSADSTAYFVGRLWGRHKLAPRVSPGKTVEGFFGGILGSVLAGTVCWAFLPFGIAWSFWQSLLLAVLIGIFGPIGDLSKSMFKRGLGVKDFGSLIPGHGGFIDRLDAVLFTSPLLYYYATIVLKLG